VFCSATGGDDDFVVFEFDASSFTAEMGVVYEMDIPVFGEVDLDSHRIPFGDQGISWTDSSYPFSSTQSLNLWRWYVVWVHVMEMVMPHLTSSRA